MNRRIQTLCMLTVGVMMFGSAGCSSKAMKSDGETLSTAPNDRMSGFSESDLAGMTSTDPGMSSTNPGMAMAKLDPAERRRQQEQARAEDRATAAAGLRDVYFGYDSWTISEEGRQALLRDAEWLRAHHTTRLQVEGHCDERGSSGYNFVLAEKRAKAVRNYLMDLGIKGDRLRVVSYGKERPFCKDRSEACYQENRRGHLVVRP